MFRRPNRLFAFTAALHLSILVGCGTQEALNYNNKVAAANAKLNQAGTEFGKSIPIAMSGGADEIASCRAAYEECTRIVEKVNSDCAKLKVPNSDAARKLQAAHQKYLQGQLDMCQNEFDEIMTFVKDTDTPAPQRAKQIEEIFTRVSAKEDATLVPLQSAQLAFAKAHNFKIE